MDDGGSRSGATDRRVLALGVALEGPDEEGPPPLDALDPLLKAPQHAAYVSEVVREFGYRQHCPADSELDLGEEVRRALKSPAEVLIVHLVAHGRLADTGERGLHVVGVDGSNLDDPVASWISLIESHPDKPRPLTLFILDLCHSGVAATLPWHQEMPAGRRRAWVLAATGSQDQAFDYRLSRATRTVLGNYLDGTSTVDRSCAYIPLPTVGREIAREVASLSAQEGFDQLVDGSRVSQLLFQAAYLTAQRGLRDVEGHGGAAEVPVLGHGGEVPDEAQIEVRRSGV
jgi:hypothetical protein